MRPLGRLALATTLLVPSAIAGAVKRAARRFIEFFAATIRNRNTRLAYYKLKAYLNAGIRESAKTPLFRSAVGRTGSKRTA